MERGGRISVPHTTGDNSRIERLGMGLRNGLVSFSDLKRGVRLAIDILPGSQNHRVSCIPVAENARVMFIHTIDQWCIENLKVALNCMDSNISTPSFVSPLQL